MNKLYTLLDAFRKITVGKEVKISYSEQFKDSLCEDSVLRKEFYKVMLNVYGFDGLPQIANPEQYKRAGEVELYHGFRAYSHGWDYLSKKEIFDYGFIPSGMYVTAHRDFAYYYTAGYRDEFPDSMKRVLSVKLATDKICHFGDIRDYKKLFNEGRFTEMPIEIMPQMLKLQCFAEKIVNDKERKEFLGLFLDNYSNLAIFLGYDAMYGGFAGFDVPKEEETSQKNLKFLIVA